jgi:hypothetical protein
MHAVAEVHDTPSNELLLTPRPALGLGTTDQVRVCALAGTKAPSSNSTVSTAPAESLRPANSNGRAHRPGTRKPRGQALIPTIAAAHRRSRAIAASLHRSDARLLHAPPRAVPASTSRMADAIQARCDATIHDHGWELASRQQPDVIEADTCRDDRGDNDGGTGQALHDFPVGRTCGQGAPQALAVQAAGAEGPAASRQRASAAARPAEAPFFGSAGTQTAVNTTCGRRDGGLHPAREYQPCTGPVKDFKILWPRPSRTHANLPRPEPLHGQSILKVLRTRPLTAPAPGSDRRLSGEAHQVGGHPHRSDHEPHGSLPGMPSRHARARKLVGAAFELQSMTATMTATWATNASLKLPPAASYCSVAGLTWPSATPEKRKAGGSTPPLTTIQLATAEALTSANTDWTFSASYSRVSVIGPT